MKRSLLKLLSLTLALLMVVSTFQGMFVFEASAEEATPITDGSSTEEPVATVGVEEESTPEVVSDSGSELVNYYYPHMKYSIPTKVLEYDIPGVTSSSDVSDYVAYRSGRAASRAVAVKPGDTIYFVMWQRSGVDPVFKYDKYGNLLDTFSATGEWAELNVVTTPTQIGSNFSYKSAPKMALYSYVIPETVPNQTEPVAYITLRPDTDIAECLMLTVNQPFTVEEYKAYWDNFDYDANTGITLNANSNLKDKNILFLGDSAMFGVNDYLAPTTGKSIAGRIALATGANVTNLAVGDFSSGKVASVGYYAGGDNTVANQFANRTDKTTQYDAVVIWAGVYDAAKYAANGNDERAEAAYAAINAIKAELPKAQIFVISAPKCYSDSIILERQGGLFNRMKAFCESTENVHLVNLYSNTALADELLIMSSKYLPDGINPTSDGYDILTPYVLEVMEDAFYVPEPLVNYYYPLKRNARPNPDLLEYAEGAAPVAGKGEQSDRVGWRVSRVAGRAFPVKAGDTIYFIAKDSPDPFYKYTADGECLTEITGSSAYENPVGTFEVTDYGYFGSYSNYNWNLYSVTIPEASEGEKQIAYLAPQFTTDNMSKHFITKNHKFTKEEYDAYWANFDPYKEITVDEDNPLNDKNILFLGDSAMFGGNDIWAPSTPSGAKGIAGRIELITGANVTNLAVGNFGAAGANSYKFPSIGYLLGGDNNVVGQFNNREDQDTQYDAIVLWAGIYENLNDGSSYGNTETFAALQSTVQTIKEAMPNAKIFVISGPLRDAGDPAWELQPGFNNGNGTDRESIASWCAKNENVYCIDLYNNTELADKLMYKTSKYFPDGINPTSDGYDIITPYVLEVMEEAFEEPVAPPAPEETEPEDTEPSLENLYEPIFYLATVNDTIIGASGTYLTGGKWSDSIVGKAVPVAEGDVIYFTNKLEATRTPLVPFDASGAKVTSVTVEPELLESFTSGSLNVGIYRYTVPAGVAYLVPEIQRNTTHHFVMKNYRFTADEYNTYWASYNADVKYEVDEDSLLKDKNILFLGDAAMNAYNDWAGLSTGKGIPARIALITGAKVTNLSNCDRNGNAALVESGYLYGNEKFQVITQFTNRADKETEYDAVVLWAGVWDIKGGVGESNAVNAAMAAVDAVRAALPNTKIFVINGPTRSGMSLTSYYGRVSSACSERVNVYSIDLYNNADLNKEITYIKSTAMPDGVHFSAEGYDILTPYVLEAMEEAFEEPVAPPAPEETEPEETEPVETEAPETEAPERTDGEYVNLYYPLKKDARHNYQLLEYAAGATPADRGTGSSIPSDVVVSRPSRFAGRAIEVKEGDVLYYTNGAANATEDPFYKYNANGVGLDTVKQSGDWFYINVAVESTQLYTYSYNGASMAIYKYVVPAGVSYVAPVLTTDSGDRHLIMKNHVFTPLQYKQYWETVDFDANVKVVEDSNLADKNILFLGDANMSGLLDYYAPSTGKSIAGRIALATGAKVTNLAANGGFIVGTTVAAQFASRNTAEDYDAIVVWSGIEDMRNEKANDDIRSAIDTTLSSIASAYPNAKIFVVTGPYRDTNYGGNAKQATIYNYMKTWTEGKSNVYCVDLFGNGTLKTDLMYATAKYIPDGIHLVSDAFDMVYPYVLDVMEDAFVACVDHTVGTPVYRNSAIILACDNCGEAIWTSTGVAVETIVDTNGGNGFTGERPYDANDKPKYMVSKDVVSKANTGGYAIYLKYKLGTIANPDSEVSVLSAVSKRGADYYIPVFLRQAVVDGELVMKIANAADAPYFKLTANTEYEIIILVDPNGEHAVYVDGGLVGTYNNSVKIPADVEEDSVYFRINDGSKNKCRTYINHFEVLTLGDTTPEHEHSVVFTDDSVAFDCAECADVKIKKFVKNGLADVRDGFETFELNAKGQTFWFVTDAGFKNIVNGNVLTIGTTPVLTVADGALKAGSVKVADVADVDTFQIAVQIKNSAYTLYVDGDKVASGKYTGGVNVTLGDASFGARAKFLYNKAVVLGETENVIAPSYTADKTNTECQHVGAVVNAALVNGKLVYDCGHCGERVYYETAETNVEAAIANRIFDLRDKVTIVELTTNKLDSVAAGAVLSIKRYGKAALEVLNVNAAGELCAVGNNVLYNKNGVAYNASKAYDVVVAYDDDSFTVRYYVGGSIAYKLDGSEAIYQTAEVQATECGIIVNENIVDSYYCAATKITEVFNYVGLQVHTESDMIRILSGIDALWYNAVGYEVSVYDENGDLVDVTKTIEGQTVYTSVGAAGEMVDAAFYGYKYFAPLVINEIAGASVGSKIVITPYAKVGDISYKGGSVSIYVTEEGFEVEKSVKFRVATANVGDFTGNTSPAADIAIQQATLASINADVLATQEDKGELPNGLYPEYEYIARLGTGDYNYKAYLSNYKLGKTSRIYFDFDAAGVNKTIYENPEKTLMDVITHGFFLYTTVEIDGYEVHMINVHVDWKDNAARTAQFEFILDFIDKNELEYVIVIGDVNPDDCTSYWDPATSSIKYKLNSGNSTHEKDLLLFTDRGEGKLNFKAANAGDLGTYHTILDHDGDPYQANKCACDNIIVSDNMNITNIEIIAEDWMNDHAYVAADIEIIK